MYFTPYINVLFSKIFPTYWTSSNNSRSLFFSRLLNYGIFMFIRRYRPGAFFRKVVLLKTMTNVYNSIWRDSYYTSCVCVNSFRKRFSIFIYYFTKNCYLFSALMRRKKTNNNFYSVRLGNQWSNGHSG